MLEILSGEKSTAQASREYQIKDSLLYRWKMEFLEAAPHLFGNQPDGDREQQANKIAELERMVGKLTMQLEIAKKASYYLKSLPGENGG